MGVAPIVRYMILCNDWGLDPINKNRINIYGLLSNVSPTGSQQYPLVQRQLCVFLTATEIRGVGKAHIRCVLEETGEVVFQTADREVEGGIDPLKIIAVPFRILGCTFPQPGIYSIQFWYNDVMVHECPLRLRRST